jgi:hypothetical protein
MSKESEFEAPLEDTTVHTCPACKRQIHPEDYFSEMIYCVWSDWASGPISAPGKETAVRWCRRCCENARSIFIESNGKEYELSLQGTYPGASCFLCGGSHEKLHGEMCWAVQSGERLIWCVVIGLTCFRCVHSRKIDAASV